MGSTVAWFRPSPVSVALERIRERGPTFSPKSLFHNLVDDVADRRRKLFEAMELAQVEIRGAFGLFRSGDSLKDATPTLPCRTVTESVGLRHLMFNGRLTVDVVQREDLNMLLPIFDRRLGLREKLAQTIFAEALDEDEIADL